MNENVNQPQKKDISFYRKLWIFIREHPFWIFKSIQKFTDFFWDFFILTYDILLIYFSSFICFIGYLQDILLFHVFLLLGSLLSSVKS